MSKESRQLHNGAVEASFTSIGNKDKDFTFAHKNEFRRFGTLDFKEQRKFAGEVLKQKNEITDILPRFEAYVLHIARNGELDVNNLIDKYETVLRKFLPAFRFEDAKEILHSCLNALKTNIEDVKRLKEKYAGDGKKAFAEHFGVDPFGEVEIDSSSPFCIYLRVFDARDYAFCEQGLYAIPGSVVSKSHIVRSRKSGGFVPYKHLNTSSQSPVVVENCVRTKKGNDSIFRHEERHAIHRSLKELVEFLQESSTSLEFGMKTRWILENEATLESKLKSFEKACRDFSKVGYEKAKDEIMAYFTGNVDSKLVAQWLVARHNEGGLYDYYFAAREHAYDFIKSNFRGDEAKAFTRVLEKVFRRDLAKRYELVLREMYQLKKAGIDTDTILGLVDYHRIGKLPAELRRFNKAHLQKGLEDDVLPPKDLIDKMRSSAVVVNSHGVVEIDGDRYMFRKMPRVTKNFEINKLRGLYQLKEELCATEFAQFFGLDTVYKTYLINLNGERCVVRDMGPVILQTSSDEYKEELVKDTDVLDYLLGDLFTLFFKRFPEFRFSGFPQYIKDDGRKIARSTQLIGDRSLIHFINKEKGLTLTKTFAETVRKYSTDPNHREAFIELANKYFSFKKAAAIITRMDFLSKHTNEHGVVNFANADLKEIEKLQVV